MNWLKTRLAAFLAALVPCISFAILPESGWYWNPAQSGRGFNIEIQDNLLFVAAFGYDTAGQPDWWVAGGPMQSDRTFTARASRVTGGQCFGCPYSAPALTDAGALTITFSDEGHATVVFMGETMTLQRQDFANLTLNPDGLYGEWAITEGEPEIPVYFGDRLSFSGPVTTGGLTYASGGRTGNVTTRTALGRFDSSLNLWTILVDSSASYYTTYRFRFTGLNHLEGQAWTYLKTESLSGQGVFFVGNRSKSRARVNGSNAPGVTKALADDLAGALDSARARVTGKAPADAPSAALLREMERALEAVRAQYTTTERIDSPRFISSKPSLMCSSGSVCVIRSSMLILPSMYQSTIFGTSVRPRAPPKAEPFHCAAGDELERPRRDLRRRPRATPMMIDCAPALVAALERLAHRRRVADALEAVVGAAVGELHDRVDDVGARPSG